MLCLFIVNTSLCVSVFFIPGFPSASYNTWDAVDTQPYLPKEGRKERRLRRREELVLENESKKLEALTCIYPEE